MLRRIAPGEDHGLSAEGANLGSAYVKYVTELRQGGKIYVCGITCQPVSEAGAVDEQSKLVRLANSVDVFQFPARINSTVFRWE